MITRHDRRHDTLDDKLDDLTQMRVSCGKAFATKESLSRAHGRIDEQQDEITELSTRVDALTSAMLGETDAAKALGLVLQDDQMKTYAASLGKAWDKLNIAEKAQLRLNAAISQSPNAVGDFARSMDSYANQMRVASAMTQDFQNTIGEGLVPVSAQLVSALNVNREFIDILGKTIGGFVNAELNSIVDGYDVLSGKSTGLTGDTLGLSTSFIGLAGGAKVAFNAVQLAGDVVVYAAKAIDTGTRQIALSVDSFLALVTFDFDRVQKNGEEFKRIGVEYAQGITKTLAIVAFIVDKF